MVFAGFSDVPKRARPKFTQKEKELHYKFQNGKCDGCGKKFEIGNLTVDHIKAFSTGGSERGHNLQLLCRDCNSSKGAGTQAQLKKKLMQRGVIKGQAKPASKAKLAKKPTVKKKSASKPKDPLADLFGF
jgi:5-methylcytosine-specific restriction endonuclease McrA